jgi:hypothetical protein
MATPLTNRKQEIRTGPVQKRFWLVKSPTAKTLIGQRVKSVNWRADKKQLESDLWPHLPSFNIKKTIGKRLEWAAYRAREALCKLCDVKKNVRAKRHMSHPWSIEPYNILAKIIC